MGTYLNGNNDTYACDSQTCQLSCASPEFGPGVCYGLQQNFLDGTECGGGGKCTNGACKGSNFGKEIKSWIDDHKTLVIGICSAVGLVSPKEYVDSKTPQLSKNLIPWEFRWILVAHKVLY